MELSALAPKMGTGLAMSECASVCARGGIASDGGVVIPAAIQAIVASHERPAPSVVAELIAERVVLIC
jgi:hypothetical protein